jgi:hypothetical protein
MVPEDDAIAKWVIERETGLKISFGNRKAPEISPIIRLPIVTLA